MVVRHPLASVLLAVSLALAASAMASAGQSAKSGALPGVDIKAGDKVVVVKPSAQPSDEPASADDNGWVRMGDWDVKVSGSVQLDIGVGKNRPVRDSGGR